MKNKVYFGDKKIYQKDVVKKERLMLFIHTLFDQFFLYINTNQAFFCILFSFICFDSFHYRSSKFAKMIANTEYHFIHTMYSIFDFLLLKSLIEEYVVYTLYIVVSKLD